MKKFLALAAAAAMLAGCSTAASGDAEKASKKEEKHVCINGKVWQDHAPGNAEFAQPVMENGQQKSCERNSSNIGG